MVQIFLALMVIAGCGSAEDTATVGENVATPAAAVAQSGDDDRDRNRSRDLIINMELSHNKTLQNSELWVGEPISVEFGEILPQPINLHVKKGDPAEKLLDPQKGRAVLKLRFVISQSGSFESHGFKDAEGRYWQIKKVQEAKDFPRQITLLVKLRKSRQDLKHRIWKADVVKVEQGQFLKQRFSLSVALNGPYEKTLSGKKTPLFARIKFKRLMGQASSPNGFVDRARRVWEIAQAELVR